MGWRTIIVRTNSKLSYKLGYMLVRNIEETYIFIEEINNLIIESNQCIISTELINQAIKNNINLIFCDEKHSPNSQLIGLNNNYNGPKNLLKQIKWNDEIKEILWQKIIINKIINQSFLLDKYGCLEHELLDEYAKNVEKNDVTNREGHAAKVYFNSLFGKDFNRRDEENETNHVLNYLYSLILSIFNRVLVEYGYNTQLGIWHKNEFNFFNLSCDLMEPFRIIVDDYYLKYKYTIKQKKELQNIFNIDIKINNCNEKLENAIKIFVKQCLNFLNEGDKNQKIPFIEKYEL